MNRSKATTPAMVRRLIMRGTPLTMGVVSLFHPHAGPSIVAALQGRLGLWLGVHLIQLALIGLLGATVWLLIDGRTGCLAVSCRLAIGSFVICYTAYDAIVGIATGMLVWLTQRLPPAEQAVATQLVEHFWLAWRTSSLPVAYIILAGELSWIVAVVAAAGTLGGVRVSRLGVGLLLLAGLCFGLNHTFPLGTLGMLSLLGAVLVFDRPAGWVTTGIRPRAAL